MVIGAGSKSKKRNKKKSAAAETSNTNGTPAKPEPETEDVETLVDGEDVCPTITFRNIFLAWRIIQGTI